jgi:hypothetical protein
MRVVDATGHVNVAKAKAAKVVGVIRYIGGPFPSGKQTDRAELDGYRKAGLDVAAVYETDVNQMTGGFSAGAHDAARAQGFLARLGIPADAPIYFPNDHESTSGVSAYMRGVASVLGKARTGIYGSYSAVRAALATGACAYGWQTYAWSGHQWDPRAVLYQHNEDGHSWGSFGQDCQDEARAADWGQERRPAAPKPVPKPPVVPDEGPGAVYRLRSAHHFWTADLAEARKLQASGFVYEGVAWRFDPLKDTEPVMRYVRGNAHIWTADAGEQTRLVAMGWTKEGTAFYGSPVGTPVYRYVGNAEHFYTVNQAEGKGLTLEGVAFYVSAK